MYSAIVTVYGAQRPGVGCHESKSARAETVVREQVTDLGQSFTLLSHLLLRRMAIYETEGGLVRLRSNVVAASPDPELRRCSGELVIEQWNVVMYIDLSVGVESSAIPSQRHFLMVNSSASLLSRSLATGFVQFTAVHVSNIQQHAIVSE